MCGVFGVISRRGSHVDQIAVDKAIYALRHRGPDDKNSYVGNGVAMAVARLSIVDIPGGRQPIFNEEATVAVVCNGEIYNAPELRAKLTAQGHHFSSKSDCETIVHLYESQPQSYVESLDGMFAFMLFDIRKGVVHVARDRLGIKPLFMACDEDRFLFSSEIKGILAYPGMLANLNRDAVFDLMTFGYDMGEQTCFEGVTSFPPATIMEYKFSGDRIRTWQYWQPTFPDRTAPIVTDIATWAERFLGTFQSSVKSHMMGDRDVGVYLSGGIDSSGLAAVLSEQSSGRLRAYRMQFPGTHYDETEFSDQVSEMYSFGICNATISDWTLDDLERAIYFLEQPQVLTLDIATQKLSKLVRDNGDCVVMAGDGADELLGGYDHFGIRNVAEQLVGHKYAGDMRELLTFAMKWYGYPGDYCECFREQCIDGRTNLQSRFGTVPPWYPVWHMLDQTKQGLFEGISRSSLSDDSELARICSPLKKEYKNIDERNKAIYLEMKTRLPNWILWKSDRNTMCNSVESRVPFLANPVLDLMQSIPPSAKSLPFNEKVLLREAFSGKVPESVIGRKKFAFNTPNRWLFSDRNAAVNDYLTRDSIAAVGVFDPVGVASLQELVQRDIGSERGEQSMIATIRLQTLTAVLTTQILHKKFVESRSVC